MCVLKMCHSDGDAASTIRHSSHFPASTVFSLSLSQFHFRHCGPINSSMMLRLRRTALSLLMMSTAEHAMSTGTKSSSALRNSTSLDQDTKQLHVSEPHFWTNDSFPLEIWNWNDLFMCTNIIKNWLNQGERLQADDGHKAEEAACTKAPGAIHHMKDTHCHAKRSKARHNHETVNERIEKFDTRMKLFKHCIENTFKSSEPVSQLVSH